jgi:ABC-type multidrug transport system fused ATPase/permease subunit
VTGRDIAFNTKEAADFSQTLYSGTVKFNVLLGANKPMEEVTDEELVQACKDANIVCAHVLQRDW